MKKASKKKRDMRRYKLFTPLSIERLRDIIPLMEAGLTADEIALLHRKTRITVMRWVRRLREAGYPVKFIHGKKGRSKLKI